LGEGLSQAANWTSRLNCPQGADPRISRAFLEPYFHLVEEALILRLNEKAFGLLSVALATIAKNTVDPPDWLILEFLGPFKRLASFRYKVLVPGWDLAIDFFLTVKGDRLFRLSLAQFLAQFLDSRPGQKGFHKNPALLVDYAVNLDPAEFPPLEADLLAEIKTQARLAYAKIELNAGRTDEAIKLYADCEPFSPNRPAILNLWATMTRDLAVALAQNRPAEALDWLTKFAALPFGLAQERRRFEALRDIVAVLPQDFLPKAKEIADQIGHIGQEETWPLGAIHRAGLYRALTERFRQLGQPEKGLAIYLETGQFPLAKMIYAQRLFALASLMDSFLSHGETAAAAHLFDNGPKVETEFYQAPSPEFESLMDSFLAKDQSRDLDSDIVRDILRESIVGISKAYETIVETAAKLVQECLNLEESDRALTVFKSLRNLPVDVTKITPATKLIVEFLIARGEMDKAEAIAKNFVDKLPAPEDYRFASYFIRLARSGPPNRRDRAN
jgi:tetratricopeptide (TPR) repeat protein